MTNDTAPAQPLETLETPREIARALKVTPQTVNNWHRWGMIPARIAVGRVIRFDRHQVIEALEAQSRKNQPEAAAVAGALQ